jgi:hypothetical protein
VVGHVEFGAIRGRCRNCQRHSRKVWAATTSPWYEGVSRLDYLPFEKYAANFFFELLARRYERGSMVQTRCH